MTNLNKRPEFYNWRIGLDGGPTYECDILRITAITVSTLKQEAEMSCQWTLPKKY